MNLYGMALKESKIGCEVSETSYAIEIRTKQHFQSCLKYATDNNYGLAIISKGGNSVMSEPFAGYLAWSSSWQVSRLIDMG